MALYKRGGVWHYDFTVDGRRYRGSTKERVSSRARMVEANLINEAKQRTLSVHRKAITLAEFSKRFLDWVELTRLEDWSKKYYRSGWTMLAKTPISGMRLSHITPDDAEALRFDGSPSNANRALRTLRRMLGKAAEWKLIPAAPRIKLVKEYGRSATIDSQMEERLIAVARQPLRDVLILILDSGMRPAEVFQLKWEDINWERGMIFIPRGKTKLSRRYIPISERAGTALLARKNGSTAGWVFPSDSACGHLTTVAKAFEKARKAAGISREVVLYSARHTFATKVMAATGNLSLVMRALGHTNAQTAMIYQHPSLEMVRDVVNENPLVSLPRHNPRHMAVN